MVNRVVIMSGGALVLLSLLLIFGQPAPAQSFNEITLSPPAAHNLENAQSFIVEFGGALGTAYSPADIRISPGDSIEWLGDFAMHPLVSDDGLWQTVNAGTQFSYTFAQPGVYPYHCQAHSAFGMQGSVTVGYFGYLPLVTR